MGGGMERQAREAADLIGLAVAEEVIELAAIALEPGPLKTAPKVVCTVRICSPIPILPPSRAFR
jgi:hypothetical protein